MHVLEACKEKIKRVGELPSALGAWTNFFYFSHIKSEEEMTTLLQDQPMVKQAYGKYKQFNQDERLRSIDEAHQRFLTDIASDRVEAREEGRADGMAERDIAIARNMKNDGFDAGMISRITGLSPTEIEQLN